MTETNAYGLQVDPAEPHLGGYFAGGDPNTWSEELWSWLIDRHEIRSMVDVGCGTGETVRWFESRGIDALGVDGIAQEYERVVQHDYTKGPYPDPDKWGPGEVDLVWSAEFVEHVAEEYVPNFLWTFRMARIVAMTHAVPGQGGHHHVNCQPADYWKGAMNAYGYAYDASLTERCRRLVDPNNYFHRTGLVFLRR